MVQFGRYYSECLNLSCKSIYLDILFGVDDSVLDYMVVRWTGDFVWRGLRYSIENDYFET